MEQRLRKLPAQRIRYERRRVRHNGRNLLAQPCLVPAAEDKLRDKIRRPPRGFTEWHAEAEKIFGVHVCVFDCELGLIQAPSGLTNNLIYTGLTSGARKPRASV